MRYAGIAIAMLVAWGGLTLLTTRGLSSQENIRPEAEFDKLLAQLNAAQSAYLDARHQALQGAREEDRARILASLPDGRVDVLRKMDALARNTAGKPRGGDIAVGVFNWSWKLDADLERLAPRFALLVEQYPNHPDLVEPVGAVAQAYEVSGSPGEWIALLEKLSRTTRDDDLRIGALFIMGQVQMKSGSLSAAKETFRRILEAYPRSEYVPRVKGLVYEIDHLQPGMAVPSFTTQTLDGETFAIESLRGKIVLLNFWATWCPTCVSEIPHLRDAYQKLRSGDRSFEIVNISLDDESADLKSFVRRFEMPGISTWEWKDGGNPVARQFNVYGLPAWFLIDDKGVIQARNPFGEKLESSVAAMRQ